MYQTEDIKELVVALSKAQGKMEPAKLNKTNSHFKNKYADFNSIIECCRQPLSENGLSVMQYCEMTNEKLFLVTMLVHISGQWIKSLFPLNPRNMDSQSIGSAMTYAKRYSLSAMLGIVSDEEDDDGEASQGRVAPQVQAKPVAAKKINTNQLAILKVQDAKLDKDTKATVMKWMLKSYNIDNIENVTEDIFPKVFSAFEGAVKSMEKSKVEANA